MKQLLPRMLPAERVLLEGFLACTEHYVEFGAGGSTCLAASLVKASVTSLDSSAAWLDDVAAACAAEPRWVQPDMILVDLGRLGGWGRPVDPETKDRWPAYHQRMWQKPGTEHADFYLIDGRFRVACFMQTLLRCKANACIGIHDFERQGYAVIAETARLVARTRNLAIFQKRPEQDYDLICTVLQDHLYVPD